MDTEVNPGPGGRKSGVAKGMSVTIVPTRRGIIKAVGVGGFGSCVGIWTTVGEGVQVGVSVGVEVSAGVFVTLAVILGTGVFAGRNKEFIEHACNKTASIMTNCNLCMVNLFHAIILRNIPS